MSVQKVVEILGAWPDTKAVVRVEDILTILEAIMGEADDYERAHSLEDRLHTGVLMAIANGAPNASDLATLALKTREIDFARYCA